MRDADPLRDLGVTNGADGGTIRVWSESATAVQLVVFDGARSLDRLDQPTRSAEPVGARGLGELDPRDVRTVELMRDQHGVWSGTDARLRPGARYGIRADGPRGPMHRFEPRRVLIDPWARGLERATGGTWLSVVPDDDFDWGGVEKPRIPLDHAVIYETHVTGLTKLNPDVPPELRGTYAGIAHPSTIDYLQQLGVTSIELLPIHQHTTEQRLQKLGLSNYWGYNTVGFFAPHAAYASPAARAAGPDAVLREVKGMVRLLHEAGIEVLLDVVYNHTAEEGRDGPTTSLRGLDDANYYRHDEHGDYIDVTGCGNTLDASTPAAQRLVLDSLRYWAEEVQIDGFRFDLMATLGRDAHGAFDPEHPLLRAILDDPVLAGSKLIAEPWDVGPGGWRVGEFPTGYLEWNDGYRDRMRTFWLRDIADARATGRAPNGIGPLARRISGSNHVFSRERGPLASVNFITAHDGFTAYDLVAFDRKHNEANGEGGRDGSDDNRSFNHGVEGMTDDHAVLRTRRRAIRNLLGTLFLSAGVPMITAGDEAGRTQRGNNNAYCHDDELTWLHWEHSGWQRELLQVSRTLTRLRRENPALRPVRFGAWGEAVPSATQMDWFNKQGQAMSMEDWDSPTERTLQYLAASTPEFEEFNRILLIVHGLEEEVTVTLPEHAGVTGYTLLWDSSHDDITGLAASHVPGEQLPVGPTSMLLLRAR